MNEFILNKIEKRNNRVLYDYTVLGEWKKYFKLDEEFFIEYGDLNIEEIPNGILVIPLLVNVLPISWVLDGRIEIGEIDKEFYDCIKKVKRGYVDMYSHIVFKGEILAETVIDNSYVASGGTAAFFSGGVDAYNTLISHVEEKPALVTLWGSDVTLEDCEGWERVRQHAEFVGKEFSCKNFFIKSSFRKFLNEGALTDLVTPKAGDGWWHGFQHGIGLIGHIAPYAFKYKLSTIYIASSFTVKDKGKVTCASDPTIDNHVKMASCRTVHDGYEFSRQDKVHNICKYKREYQKKILLRVCWQSSGGSNCCHCEKCYRTICAIIAEGENPREMGFEYDDRIYSRMKKDIKYKFIFDDVMRTYWYEIQQCLKNRNEQYDNLLWLNKFDFKKYDIEITFSKKMYQLLQKIKRRFNR